MAMVDEKWGNQQVAAYDSSYNKANYWGKKSIKISFGPGMSNAPGTGRDTLQYWRLYPYGLHHPARPLPETALTTFLSNNLTSQVRSVRPPRPL
jgi:hypothetical protein